MKHNYLMLFFALFLWAISPQEAEAQYCQPAYSSGCSYGDGLTFVGFETISQNVGCASSVNDFTTNIASVTMGETYVLTLVGGYSNTYFECWIDLNGNEVWDAGEKLAEGNLASSGVNYTYNIVIPLAASSGTTRLRVFTNWNSAPSGGPCGSYSYGNSSDFGLLIAPNMVYDCDLEAIAWIEPALFSSNLGASEQVTVTIKNVGALAQAGFTVSYSIDNGLNFESNLVSDSIFPGDVYSHTFTTTANFATGGNYNCIFEVDLACDEDTTNNLLAVVVNNAVAITSFPYFEDFESTTNAWTSGGTNNSWQYGTPATLNINSAFSPVNCWNTNLTGDYNNSENSWVESPLFNFSTLVAPILEMRINYITETNWDGGVIQYSFDGGVNWTTLGVMNDPYAINWYNTISTSGPFAGAPRWTNTSNGWISVKYNIFENTALMATLSNSTVKFRVNFRSDGSGVRQGIAFDDFTIYNLPDDDAQLHSILQPSGQAVSGSTLDPVVVVRNLGLNNITALTLSYQVDGGSVINHTYTGLILPTAFDTITLPSFTVAATGNGSFKAWLSLLNDPIQSNDTLTSSFSILPYACNYAMSFNGTNNWIQILDDASLNSTDYTIEAWVKPNEFGWLKGIASRYMPGGYGWVIRLSSTWPYSKVSFNESDANYVLNINEWYHLAAVNSNGVNTLYINGVPYSVAGNNLPNISGTIAIGNDYMERWWNGLIDEVRIWKTALTQAEVNSYMVMTVDPSHTAWNDLAAYYTFDEPGGLAFDSKNNNHGIIHGASYVVSDLQTWICEDDDARLASFIAPIGQSVEGNSLEPIVVVQNMGFNTITSLTLSYNINGGPATSYSYTGSIVTGQTDTISLPSFISGSGTNTITAWVDLLNDANQNNDTLSGQFTALPIICNYALDMNGSGEYAELPAGQYFSNNFTVEAWVYKRSNNFSSRLIDFGNGAGNNNILIQVNDGSTSKIRFSIIQGSSEMAITSNYIMPLHQWVHIAVSYDGVAGRIYINGVEDVNGSIHNPLPVVRNNCWIGRSAWTGDGFTNMIIDEFKIWNSTLLPQTIANNLYSPATAAHPNYSTLSVYYNFNEPVNNPVEDLAGNNNLNRIGANYTTQAAPVVCDPYDASITDIASPIGTIVESTIINPEVLLTNLGVEDLTAAVIYYSLGFDTLIYNYSGMIFLGQTDTVSLGDITVPSGTSATLCVWVEIVNDANPLNNQYCESYTIMENACNYALYFDGNGDFVSIPVSPETEALTSVYTLECWFKPEEFGFLDGLISKYQFSGLSGFQLRMGQIAPYNVLNFDEQNAGPLLVANQWYHVAAINNNGLHRLYLNGVEYLSSASATYNPNNTDIRFAVDYGNRWFKGYMDEVRIWNAALSANDIQNWMQQSITPAHPEYINLVGYWTFDDLAPVATDSKSYHDGIIYNAVYKPSDAPFACGTSDVGVVAITTPATTFFQGNLNNLTVEIFNYGTDTITQMDIIYEVDGGNPVTYSWTGVLVPVGTVSANLPPFIGPSGSSAIITAYTDLPGDLATYNNETSKTLTGITPYEIALVSFAGPAGGCGLQSNEYIELNIQNNGDSILSDLIISVMSLPDSVLITELVNYTVLPLQSFVYTFNTPVDLYVGTGIDSTFSFTAWISHPDDANSANNQINFNIESVHAGTAPLGMDTTILFGTSATVYGNSSYPIFWFEQEFGGNNILMGDTFITPLLYDTTTYWIESSASAPYEVTIGSGTATTSFIPAYGYYDYSWSGAIYRADEIGAQMEINSIWYYVGNSPSNYTMNNQKVFMKHITNNTYPNSVMPDWNSMTEVFSGNIIWNGTGWYEIELSTPFIYNGTDNLEVGWQNHDGSYVSGNPTFRYTSVASTAKYRYQDGSFPTTNGTLTANRANIRLDGSSVGCPSERVPVTVYVANIPNYDVSVNAILAPSSGFVLSSCETVSIELTNWGAMDITMVPLTIEMDNGSSYSDFYTSTLLSGETVIFDFNIANCIDLSVFGTYELCIYASVANDAFPMNDTLCISIENSPLSYCNSTALYNSYIEVVQFSIASWSNFSGPATGATYSDFTTVAPAELIIGQSAITYLKPEHYGSSWDVFSNYKIYIDYNQDGVFDPVSELAFGTNVWGQNGSFGQITIPQTATAGTTGMRLVFNRTDDANAVTPCGTYSYGETEDYMITLTSPAPFDAGITEIIEPSGYMIENYPEPVQVRIQNFGTEAITELEIHYSIDGGTPVSYPWMGYLAPFTNMIVNLQAFTVPALNFEFCAFTELLNDGNSSNDSLCVSLYGNPQYQAALNQLSGLATGCNLGIGTVNITLTNQADTIFPGMLEVNYHAPGINNVVTEFITETILPGTTFNYTFATGFDQTVTVDTEILFTAWIVLDNDPITSNDSISISYWSSLSPATPIVDDLSIFANEQAVIIPVNNNTALIYTWFNQYMSQMGTGVPFITPALTDTTLFKVRASTPGNQGGCLSDVTEFYVNVEYADYDAKILAINEPNSGAFLGNTETVEALIYNNGLNEISNFQVGISINGVSILPELITDTIQPGAQLLYTFTSTIDLFQSGYGPLADGFGVYDICVYTLLTNDGFTGNDTLCIAVENQNGDGLTCGTSLPYGEINDPAAFGATAFSNDAVWYSFTASTDYTGVAVSLCGSAYDTKLEVFSACGAAYMGYNDDYCGLQSQLNFANMTAGTYYAKVYGYGTSFGSYVLTITGTQVAPFTVDLLPSHITCFGQANGSINLSINNIWGQAPFTFNWSDGSSTEDISGLIAGNYFVTVSDASGVTVIENINLTQPNDISITETLSHVNSIGGNTGGIDILVEGGTQPYAYAWGQGATTQNLENLFGGYYELTVTDANGCIQSENYTISAPVPAGWEVTPTNLIHNIHIPFNAPVTLDADPVALGSYVGVFYDMGGVLTCGGYVIWTGQDALLKAYGATSGQDNGFQVNETFIWKVYDVNEMDAFNTTVTYETTVYPNQGEFVIGGLSGVSAVSALSIVVQTVVLPEGWSLWSIYVDPIDPNIVMVLADICMPFNAGNVEIVKNYLGALYWPGFGINTIGNVNYSQGYQIKISSSNGNGDVFTVSGLQFVPEITPISIPVGWGIISYLRSSPGNIVTLLAPVAPMYDPSSCVEIVKNSAGQLFWPGFGINTIGNMIPGQGYQTKNSCANLTLTYPSNNLNLKDYNHTWVTSEYYSTPKPSGNSMTIGIPAYAWATQVQVGDEIGVFNATDELVGTAVYDGGFTAITVWGQELITDLDKQNERTSLRFELWKHQELESSVLYIDRWEKGNEWYAENKISIAGSVQTLSTERDENYLGQNFPNPFSKETIIPFYIKDDGLVKLSIFNVLGEEIEILINEGRKAGLHSVEFSSKLPAGNYYYRLQTENFSSTKAMNLQ